MNRLLQEVYAFNLGADFIGKGMDSFKELSYTFEECFEGYEEVYNTLDSKGNPFKPGDKEYPNARAIGVSLANSIRDGMLRKELPELSDVAELDKSLDICMFNLGKMFKMGLSVEQVEQAFSIVADANISKLGAPKDSAGKQLKPEGWVGPEDKLQELLNTRKGI